jgi:hypothetical protein
MGFDRALSAVDQKLSKKEGWAQGSPFFYQLIDR